MWFCFRKTNKAVNLICVMDRDKAFSTLEGIKEQMLAEVPSDKWDIREKIIHWMSGARLHLRMIYESCMSVGEGFRGVARYIHKEGYENWLLGIHRHFSVCRNAVHVFNPEYEITKP